MTEAYPNRAMAYIICILQTHRHLVHAPPKLVGLLFVRHLMSLFGRFASLQITL